MPRQPLHKIWMWSNQQFIRYHAHKLFGGLFFSNVNVGHLDFTRFFPKANQIIRNTQRATTSNLNAIQTMVHKISHPQAFRVAIFCKMSSVSYLNFHELFPKVNQNIRKAWKPLHKFWMWSNQQFIRYRAHKLFRWLFFSKLPPLAISFLMDSSQKLIRPSEIPREPPHQIWMRSNQWFIRYRVHKLFGRPFFQNILRQPSCFRWFFPQS